MTPPPERPSPEPPPLLRFDRVERAVHWANALLFLTLMVTGAVLYVGPLSAAVGHRVLVRTVHVWSGLALPVPFVMGLAGRHGARLREDLRRLDRWSRSDFRWLRRRHRPSARLGKFNPGQKLNAAFLAGAAVVMLGTGSIMHWFEPFPDAWRTGATFVHDWFAFGVWLAVSGHVLLALADPEAMRGMTRGRVSARWARLHRPRWYEEVTGEPAERVAARSGPGGPYR
ncbi:MAG: cytochrome b/b6 domain-containing protein [Acidimicrobiia bacterium]|nr:cytochrome b/b6 domain-containing protein [Acidimicrobiia bacterium]